MGFSEGDSGQEQLHFALNHLQELSCSFHSVEIGISHYHIRTLPQ